MRSRESVDSVGRRGRGGKWNALAFVSREARRQGRHREESAVPETQDSLCGLWTGRPRHTGGVVFYFSCVLYLDGEVASARRTSFVVWEQQDGNMAVVLDLVACS